MNLQGVSQMQLPLYLMSWEEGHSEALLPAHKADLPGCSSSGQDGPNMATRIWYYANL